MSAQATTDNTVSDVRSESPTAKLITTNSEPYESRPANECSER